MWVCGGLGSKGVTLADEEFGLVREVGDTVGNVAAGDVLVGSCSEDPAEHPLASTTGGRGTLQVSEGFLCFLGEGAPVGLAEVSESVVGGFWEGHGEGITKLNEDGEVIGVKSDEGEPL